MIWKVPASCPEVEVSAHGEVRARVQRVNNRWKRGRGGKSLGDLYAISVRNQCGIDYESIRVMRGGRRMEFRVNRLVCEAFHGPAPSPNHHAAHINGDSRCNVPANLYWATPQQNIDDRERHGRTSRGSAHYRAKLNEQQVPAIRERIARGEPMASIAIDYGVSHHAIYDIKRGKSWRTAI